jgi:ribosomal protein S18 acetylase RimI-like enzyme
MAAIAELMQGLASMLAWPAPLRLRKLAEADIEPLAALIVAVQCEYGFPWLATEAEQQQEREGKAKNLRHSLQLCMDKPEGNALWVLEHTGGNPETQLGAPVFRLVGCVGIRRAAEPGNGTGWGQRAAELVADTSTAELHELYLHPSLRGKKLGLRLYDTAEAFAKACGYTSIWLESVARFSASKALYERNGFVTVDRIDNKFEDEIMVKSIAPVGEVVGAPTAAAQAGRAAAAGALGAGTHAQGEAPLTRKQASAAAAARFRARKAAKAEAERAAKLAARRAEIAANVAKAIEERDGAGVVASASSGTEPPTVERSIEAPAVDRSIEPPGVDGEARPQAQADVDGT